MKWLEGPRRVSLLADVPQKKEPNYTLYFDLLAA